LSTTIVCQLSSLGDFTSLGLQRKEKKEYKNILYNHLTLFHLKKIKLWLNLSNLASNIFSGALVMWNILDSRILEMLMCQLSFSISFKGASFNIAIATAIGFAG